MEIDPNLLNIILSVIANGATSLLAFMASRGEKFVTGEKLLHKLELQKSALEPILQNAIEQFADETDLENIDIQFFLRSPEVESIVRQLYAVNIVNGFKEDHIESIRTEFETVFKKFMDWSIGRETKIPNVHPLSPDTGTRGTNKAATLCFFSRLCGTNNQIAKLSLVNDTN